MQGTSSVQNTEIERLKEPSIKLMHFRTRQVLAEGMVIKAVMPQVTVPTATVTITVETCLKILAM